MPIEIKCPNCKTEFRAPDKFAGKRVKCPKCQGTIAVPAVTATAPKTGSTAQPSKQQKAPEKPKQPKPATTKKPVVADKPAAPVKKVPVKKVPVKKAPVKKVPVKKVPVKKVPVKKVPVKQESDQWYVQTDDDEQYGPVSKDELHDWIGEGRLDASCQVLCEGWEQWKWAEEVFDELGKTHQSAAKENPFAGIGDATPSGEVPNPFESPQTSSSPTVADTDASGDVRVTPAIRHALAQTRPWVLFLSIFGLIGSGLGLLMMLLVIVMSLLTLMIPNILAGLFGIAIYGFYIYAAYQLLRYAQQLNIFLRRGGANELEQALIAQKSFWKLTGIATLVALGLSVLMVVLIVVLMAVGIAVLSNIPS